MKFILVAVVAVLALRETALAQTHGPEKENPEIADLIGRLASKRFQVREEAQRLLLQREDAVSALRRALQSDDKDLSRRAAAILEGQRRLEVERAIQKLRTLADKGYVDQVVERLICRQDWGEQEDAAFQVLSDITGKLIDLEKKELGAVSRILDRPRMPGDAGAPDSDPLARRPFRDFRRYKTYNQPAFIYEGKIPAPGGGFIFRGGDVSIEQERVLSSLIASSGAVRGKLIGNTAIFAGSSLTVESMGGVVVVCDGDVKVAGEILNAAIVVARGKVICPEDTRRTLVVSSETIQLSPREKPYACLFKEKQSAPLLGYVQFFEPVQAGIEVLAHKQGVRVKAVAEEKRFARAGVKPDDILIAVDTTDVNSPEQFRRLLRRKLAEEKVTTFTLLRAEKSLAVRISMKD